MTEPTQETLPPKPQTGRFRIYKMSRSIWAVHDTTKPYGQRATFFSTQADAEAYMALGKRAKIRYRKENPDAC